MWYRRSLLAAWAVLALAAAVPAPAAGQEDRDEDALPAYSVARLKIFEGTVWVRTSDTGEWEEYSQNSPITERSRLSVPEGSEGELQFHGGQFMLLAGGAEIDVRRMEDDGCVFRLRTGEIRFDLPQSDFSPVQVALPGGSRAVFEVPGKYWLSVLDTGQSRLTVRAGEGIVRSEKGDTPVGAGEQALIGDEVSVTRYYDGTPEEMSEPPLTDEETRAGVPPSVAYELRSYGDWVDTPDYGYVWRPRVAVGWSPYYYGYWSWVTPIGWTWIAYEPWGWYPYHCGYWYSYPGVGWVWCPFRSFVSVSVSFGARRYPHYYSRVYYRPAMVRFIREGNTVRWSPLRPGERAVRAPLTRGDGRLGTWEKPIGRGKVFVREGGARGKPAWRDVHEIGAVRGGTARKNPPSPFVGRPEKGRGGDGAPWRRSYDPGPGRTGVRPEGMPGAAPRGKDPGRVPRDVERSRPSPAEPPRAEPPRGRGGTDRFRDMDRPGFTPPDSGGERPSFPGDRPSYRGQGRGSMNRVPSPAWSRTRSAGIRPEVPGVRARRDAPPWAASEFRRRSEPAGAGWNRPGMGRSGNRSGEPGGGGSPAADPGIGRSRTHSAPGDAWGRNSVGRSGARFEGGPSRREGTNRREGMR